MPTVAATSLLITLTCAPVSNKNEFVELPALCDTVMFANSDSQTVGCDGSLPKFSKSDGNSAGGPPTMLVVVSATFPKLVDEIFVLSGAKSTFGLRYVVPPYVTCT